MIELRGVDKIYRSGRLVTRALEKINLTIKAGELVAIMGPSGSGKSTLMSIIGLLDRPSAGQLKIDGQPVSLKLPDARLARLRSQKIGFVFQAFNLLPKTTALANVMLPASYRSAQYRISPAEARQRAEHLLKQVGLGERLLHRPSELSGGEKQRVAIARALINEPEIILADEPTGNLDSQSGQEIMALLKELNNKGKTVVLITHDSRLAQQCRRTVRLLDGQIVPGHE